MSLTFTLPCPELLAEQLVHPETIAHVVGTHPLDQPFPAKATHLAIPGKTTRPVEIWSADGLLHVRLPTNAATAETSMLGIAVLAAASRASDCPVHNEEGETLAYSDFIERYDDDWCRQHALFGMNALMHALEAAPGSVALMGSFQGYLVLDRSRLTGITKVSPLLDQLKQRAWIHDAYPERSLTRVTFGSKTDHLHESEVLCIDPRVGAWVQSSDRWVELPGLSGVLPMAEFLLLYGERLTFLDDGCAVLPALTAEETRTLMAEANIEVRDPAWLDAVPSIGVPSKEGLQHDLRLTSPAMALLDPNALMASHAPKPVGLRAVDLSPEQLATLPDSVLRSLAGAPTWAALLVAQADGEIDRREISALVRSGPSTLDPTIETLWRQAYGTERELPFDNPDAQLVQACNDASVHLEPAPRAQWATAVMGRAQATAEASGGGFFAFFTGRNRVDPREQHVLDSIQSLLQRSNHLP